METDDFQFKSYAMVRALVYQAHAVRNQYIIGQLLKKKNLNLAPFEEAKSELSLIDDLYLLRLPLTLLSCL